MRRHLDAGAAIFRRDMRIFLSYRWRWASQLGATIFSATLFYYISRLVRADSVGSSDDYYAFVVIGLMVLGVLTATLTAPGATLRQELVLGTFERLVLSPFGAVRGTLAMTLFPVTLAAFMGLAGLVFAAAVFELPIRWETAALGVGMIGLGAVAFAPLGLMLAAAVLLLKQAQAGAGAIMTLISLVAGIYFPATLLPGALEWLSEVQPFTPTLDLTRHLLVDAPLEDGVAGSLVRVAGFAIVLYPLATLVMARALTRARRRGTIIEY